MNRIPLLEARGLEKRYRTVLALAGLDLAVEPGQVVALLGPNGAGKSTALRLLLGLVRPDQGSILWRAGGVERTAPPPEWIGYLPEERGLFREAPVVRTVAHFARLRGMGAREARLAAERWLARLGLAERAQEKPDALSKGNQQKVQLAAALVHGPSFAVLDEPFSGLDPLNQELFLELVAETTAAGTGIVLSAHHLELVERAAHRLVILDRGRVRFDGTVVEARDAARAAGSTLELELLEGAPLSVRSQLEARADVVAVRAHAERAWTVELRADADISAILAQLGADLRIARIASRTPSLHEFYVDLLGGTPDGTAADSQGGAA